MATINSMTMKYDNGALVCVIHGTAISKKKLEDGANGFYCLKCQKARKTREDVLAIDLANGYPLAIS